MPTIDMSDIVNDPDFAQSWTVMRSSGTFARGGYVATACPIIFYGIIQPATTQDIQQVPEGDRATGAMSFISEQRMYTTNATASNKNGGLSDTICWNGNIYKIVSVDPWKDFGFWKAVGTRQP